MLTQEGEETFLKLPLVSLNLIESFAKIDNMTPFATLYDHFRPVS